MANAVATRIGQVNLSGVTDAMFMKVWSGEVYTAFAENNIGMSRTQIRTITSGKSASFPVIGKGGAQYHTPGTEILGTVQGANERLIDINDLLIADRFVALIDEAKNHYDYRAPLSADCGRALAKELDVNILRNVVLASRATSTVTGGFGGSLVTNAAMKTSASVLAAAAFSAAEAMDNKDIPKENRYLGVNWASYYQLVQSGLSVMSNDFNPQSNGSVAMGKIYWIAGFQIVPTNNLPTTNVTTGLYQGDFTKTAAVAWHESAVGTVKLLELQSEMDYDIRRQGTLLVSKLAVGHGILRPESAVELATP